MEISIIWRSVIAGHKTTWNANNAITLIGHGYTILYVEVMKFCIDLRVMANVQLESWGVHRDDLRELMKKELVFFAL